MEKDRKTGVLGGFLSGVMVLSLAAPVFSQGGGQETGFLSRTLSFQGRAKLYQVYVPPKWTPDKKWPIVLFLNGAGERGSDGVAQTTSGLGPAIKAHPKWFKAVVVFPQCPSGVWWTTPGMTDMAMEALEKEIQEFNGDPRRIYLTGISMGGYGAYMLAAQHPGFFAALTPISGGLNAPPDISDIPPAVVAGPGEDPYAALAAKIGALPTWSFHDADDPIVPVSEDRKIAAAFKGRSSFRYTELNGFGHLAWLSAYNNKKWVKWFFKQKNPVDPVL